jgi:hypothetical protein
MTKLIEATKWAVVFSPAAGLVYVLALFGA